MTRFGGGGIAVAVAVAAVVVVVVVVCFHSFIHSLQVTIKTNLFGRA